MNIALFKFFLRFRTIPSGQISNRIMKISHLWIMLDEKVLQ
ncbi:MAG: hypothetical protein ACYDH1_05425 [Anaerolineaceae bacterium]